LSRFRAKRGFCRPGCAFVRGGLLRVRKVMHAGPPVWYSTRHENRRLTDRVGEPPASRRTARPRRVLHPGGRRLPRRRPVFGTTVGGHFPEPGGRGPHRPSGLRAASEADADAGEDRAPLAGRQPIGAWVRYGTVDRPAALPTDPGRVRHAAERAVPQRLDAGPRLLPPEASPRSPPARPRGDRRLARIGLAAHQKRRDGSRLTSP
jgi:hypothetical protein